MKRKIITLGSILFMCLALVSVGFAAWVISGNAQKTTTGSIQTDTVVDKSYSMTDLTSSDNKIVFGAPTDSNQGWLTNDSQDKEKLTVTFTATVKQGSNPVDFTGDTTLDNKLQAGTTLVTAEVKADDPKYVQAVTDNLVKNPTVTVSGDASGVITVTVSVEWGTAFNGQNPYTYYNGLEQANYQQEAITKLNALNLLNSVTYNLTVTVTEVK